MRILKKVVDRRDKNMLFFLFPEDLRFSAALNMDQRFFSSESDVLGCAKGNINYIWESSVHRYMCYVFSGLY